MFKPLLSKAKVLIIDDEPSNVRLLERMLENFGMTRVKSTSDPRTALALYSQFSPDIIFLDLHMPHVDGFAVMEQLKGVVPPEDYVPILVLTADITPETKRRALSSGAKDYITKPLDHLEVMLRMKNLLENRFLHLELKKQNSQLEHQIHERTAQLEVLVQELRSTQEQVVRQERLSALGMMAVGVAHDFNNALTMMLGYGELLVPHFRDNAPEREFLYLKHILDAAKDAAHVVRRLRDFYRPATENEIRVAVGVNDLVSQAVVLTLPKWKGKPQANGVQIEVRTHFNTLPQVAGNASELREVLTNLIFNAVDAMPAGGTIDIHTDTHANGVSITVTDSGIGMTPNERERCLEPFFTTKGDAGTGLGLSVVYGIVQRHGGTIEIISQPGEGTTFCIVLPIAEPTRADVPAKCAPLGRSLRVLVVDDEPIITELVGEYLRADGHQASTALDGAAALAMFEEHSFDLVITDRSMPVMNGDQLAKAIAKTGSNVPVILCTGFGEELQAAGKSSKGINLVISKPISAAGLRQAILTVAATAPGTLTQP